jgi:hypothetical protein
LLLASITSLALGFCGVPQDVHAQVGPCCVVPDNGSGTADHPPSCPSGYAGQMEILDGLIPAATIDVAAILGSFAGLVQVPGGSLLGMKENWTGTMSLALTGTGTLLGFNRNINLPVSAGESHSAPRTPFAPSQSFNTVLWGLQAQVVGDPDFDLLRITAGTNFGLPSPGHTIFTQDAGGWAVDSFFDITYRIDFVGSPGSPLAGKSGSTTGFSRFEMCHDRPTPARKSTWGTLKKLYR